MEVDHKHGEKTMQTINIKPFNSPDGDRSILKNVPLQYLNETLNTLRTMYAPCKFRVMYRGPRRSDPRDVRSNYSKQSGCLKAYANRFSVYVDTRKVVR